MTTAGISLGKRQSYSFVSAGELEAWSPSQLPAVYAITFKKDPEMRPKSHTVLFFGEGDLSQQVGIIEQCIRNWWPVHNGKATGLYMFIHPMPGSTRWDRVKVQSQLIAEYDPQGNQ